LLIRTDISYWKAQVGLLGYAKEIISANVTGGVASTGALRQFTSEEINRLRREDSSLTK